MHAGVPAHCHRCCSWLPATQVSSVPRRAARNSVSRPAWRLATAINATRSRALPEALTPSVG
jgi:hypothetical protein